MDYIEKLIRNSWNKIPEKFKNRVKDVIIQADDKERRDARDVYFSTHEINKKFQRIIDLMLIEELVIKYGFTEEEGWEVMKALSDSSKK